jgi:hypothetical protein
VREQWAAEMPRLDTTPISVIARLGRAHAYVDPELHRLFAEQGLTRMGWDILASLRRIGPPNRLTPTELYRMLMRTSGAVTHTSTACTTPGSSSGYPTSTTAAASWWG